MTMNVGIEDFTQLDAYHGLLPALARGLDVHDIFQQLSAAAERIVPHDVANLFLRVDDTDNFRLYAVAKRAGATRRDRAFCELRTAALISAPEAIESVPLRTGRYASAEVRIRIVSELCHIPPQTPA